MEQDKGIDLRKHIRSSMIGLEVDIADKVGFCSGTIKDVSRFGVCIADISRTLRLDDGMFTVAISGQGHHFKFKVQEKWETKDGFTTIVGAFIDNVPWAWTEMVMKQEPKDDDVWGTQ